MTDLKHRIKLALDESRMLVLGTQILLGFQFRSVFEPAFEKLPSIYQDLKIGALLILLSAIALIMAPGSYHRIVRAGSDAEDVHQFATIMMDIALVPFLLAFALDLYLSNARILGGTGGLIMGSVIGAIGLFSWYGFGLLSRSHKREAGQRKKDKPQARPTSLDTKIDRALTEARVVLPGAQALLGFQLATMFMDKFDELPNSSKYVHIISLGLMAVTMVILMSPAAYHRIAERGQDTDRFYHVASALLLAAMVVLPLGICGDVFIVIRKVTNSIPVSIAMAILVLGFFYGLWFGFTTYRRSKLG